MKQYINDLCVFNYLTDNIEQFQEWGSKIRNNAEINYKKKDNYVDISYRKDLLNNNNLFLSCVSSFKIITKDNKKFVQYIKKDNLVINYFDAIKVYNYIKKNGLEHNDNEYYLCENDYQSKEEVNEDSSTYNALAFLYSEIHIYIAMVRYLYRKKIHIYEENMTEEDKKIIYDEIINQELIDKEQFEKYIITILKEEFNIKNKIDKNIIWKKIEFLINDFNELYYYFVKNSRALNYDE